MLWNFLDGASARRKHCSASVICDTSYIRGPSVFRTCCRAVQHLRASTVKRVIPVHDSNWTTVFESILTELVWLIDEYSCLGAERFAELNDVWLEAWCHSCVCQQSIHGHQFRSHWYGNKISLCVKKTWKSPTKSAEWSASLIPEYQHRFHCPGKRGGRQCAWLVRGAGGGREGGVPEFVSSV